MPVKAQVFETSASTNSAIRALLQGGPFDPIKELSTDVGLSFVRSAIRAFNLLKRMAKIALFKLNRAN
jgi:hypothetical protein